MLALCDFAGWSEQQVKEHLVNVYQATREEVDRFKILIAHECEDSYDGYSNFLLEEKSTGKVFEIHGSHCSCYGFEGQFKPEATTAEYLLSEHAGWYSEEGSAKNWVRENIRLTSAKVLV